jgi:hypothetical protein
MNNPIIDEIREARAALAAEHGYDLARINDWARQQTLARQLQNRRRENKASLLTPDPPPVPAVVTDTTSIPCSTLAPGQA